jgi:hypothetical protein
LTWWARRRWRLPISFVVICVLVLTVLALLGYFGLFVHSLLQHWTFQHLTALLWHWQTQTGAAFALVAALVGAWAVMQQTKATERQAEERRNRRAEALRTTLPVVLTELMDYAIRCAELYARTLASAVWPEGERLPPLPSGFVDRLSELIEQANPAFAEALTTLIRVVQIQCTGSSVLPNSLRIRPEVMRDEVLRSNVVFGMINTAEVLAWCVKLTPFARGTEKTPPTRISVGDMKRAAEWVDPAILDELTEWIPLSGKRVVLKRVAPCRLRRLGGESRAAHRHRRRLVPSGAPDRAAGGVI